ncbi:TetR/AcrR family transcriptional regulator [Tepidicaulis sp. LMO-SS28]|uniref:TetR/AcrR family transcriptional regulator n=1 Tax=Tepidicaulis sp. LMO-SS28 TaxID=3447455 RepID=UPI003EE2D12E
MKKGEETRARMLATAAGLFQAQGYAATGLGQIIDEARVPRGSLYFHFPGGKEELAAAAVEAAGAHLAQLIGERLAAADTPAAALGALADHFAGELKRSGFSKGCPVSTVALEATAETPRLKQACAGVYRAWLSLIESRLTGLGIAEARAALLAQTWLGAIEGAILLSKSLETTEPLTRMAKELGRLAEEDRP